MILKYLDKNNLHHAYLIEGKREEVLPEILEFMTDLGINTVQSPDFCQIFLDSFKIEDALNLRSMGKEKGFSLGKKIFIICSNSFTLDAQGALLKIFEVPIENTHFFLIVPDVNSLLKTLVSRFYVISARQPARNASRSDLGGGLAEEVKEAEKFIGMSLQKRIDFLKELLPKKDEENKEEISTESNSSIALRFLNALELVMHKEFLKNSKRCEFQLFYDHIFKVRKFLRMPGSSPKTLMESVALVAPKL